MTSRPHSFLDRTTSWDWSAIDDIKEHDVKNDDDADWEMAWRLQLEDLEEWSCTRGDRRDEEEDAEFAIIQQVEEIERAEREQAQAAGKSGLSSWIEEGGQIGDEQADKEFLNMAKACGCHCGAHFCYACGMPWKTCHCAQWDDEKLLEKATELVTERAAGDETQAPEASTFSEGRRHRDATSLPQIQQQEASSSNQQPTTSTSPHPNIQSSRSSNRGSPAAHLVQVRPSRARARRAQPRPPPPMTTIPEDPPPPYPGRSDDIIVPPQPFYDTIPNPRFPYPQLAASLLPLSRVEFERLRASVRTVVDVLNALLVGLDEEEGRGGGGVTGWGDSDGIARAQLNVWVVKAVVGMQAFTETDYTHI
ncbi:hypothetical protein GTA08_BOTSDO04055 [Botryosphaeria dothidea]|uniref:Uncharacterized protein n=1 Tax=Botryosphaeria dothidea TaxID=55169 RepID=A0A8H4IUN9_9PEZI|nr:hypothetical protein GTA08_BOTSDO04055 [Botryosphaeria dothidea]